MQKKTVSEVMILLLSISILTMTCYIRPVKAQPSVRVYVDQPLGYIPFQAPGTRFTFTINISTNGLADGTPAGIIQWKMDIRVDPDVLDINTTVGTGFPPPYAAKFSTGPGHFLYEFAGMMGYSAPALFLGKNDPLTGYQDEITEIGIPSYATGAGDYVSSTYPTLLTVEITSKNDTQGCLIDLIDVMYRTGDKLWHDAEQVGDGYYGAKPLVPTITDVSGTPGKPSYDDEVAVTCTIVDDVGIDQALLSYTYEAIWYNVSMYGFDDTYNATIPAQSYGTLVQYMIYANDTDGNWGVSNTYSYTVIDDVRPVIHFVKCTSLLDIYANVTEPPSASGVNVVRVYLQTDNGNPWVCSTELAYDSTLGLWTRTVFSYNQLAGKTIAYRIVAYDKVGNSRSSDTFDHSVEEWRIADLNRDGKVDRVDLLLVVRRFRLPVSLIGFAGLLIGSVFYVKRRRKKQV